MNTLIKYKTYLIGTVAIVTVASLSWNAYIFGSEWLKRDRTSYYNLGVIMTRNIIVDELNKNGQVDVSGVDLETFREGVIKTLVEKK